MVKHKDADEFWCHITIGTKKPRQTAIICCPIYQIVKNVQNNFKSQTEISLEWCKMCLLNNFGKSAPIYWSVDLQGQAGDWQELGVWFCFREGLARDPWKAQDLSLKTDGQIALMCKRIKYWRVKRGNWREHTGGKKSPLNCFGVLEMHSDLSPLPPARASVLLSTVITFLSLAGIHSAAQLHQEEIWYGIKKS